MISLEKIRILGNAGSHDLCSGTVCKTNMHKSLLSSVYPAVTGTGKCINLFKTLMTNACTHDCKYCINRRGNCRHKVKYSPEELANTFLKMKSAGHVQGLFLSSAIGKDPDTTMSEMIRSVEILREERYFNGYIHLKVLPGSSRYLVHRACALADRVSINIETTQDHLAELSTDKGFKDLIRRLSWIRSEEVRGNIPSGSTTQFIVGAAGEGDDEILRLVSRVYESFKLRRVYFSAFTPLKGTPLQSKPRINPLRSHRLYQTDFLLRKYGFKFNEIAFDNGLLNLGVDPKVQAALNDDRFPIDINEARYNDLIRVPGIGPKTGERIVGKKFNSLKELKAMGVITNRAAPFIKIKGETQARLNDFIRQPEYPCSESLAS